MKCAQPDCDGEYETREVVYAVNYRAVRIAVEGLPAAICPQCGHTVISSEALCRLDTSLRALRPSRPEAVLPSGWRTVRCAP
jgi:YgiT-type zinc finger domain-containing protein